MDTENVDDLWKLIDEQREQLYDEMNQRYKLEDENKRLRGILGEKSKVLPKASYIGAPAVFELELACKHINEAFGGFGAYNVGSSLERPNWRDVDVRYILPDDEFTKLFPDADDHWEQDARWLLLTVAISAWLEKHTGLPIDFQFQKQSHANARHTGFRNPTGINVRSKRKSTELAEMINERVNEELAGYDRAFIALGKLNAQERADNLKVGDYVRYDAGKSGSWGRIEEINTTGDGFYVRWNYGTDVKGKALTGLSNIQREKLIPVPKDWYDRYSACESTSLERAKVLTEYFQQPDIPRGWCD